MKKFFALSAVPFLFLVTVAYAGSLSPSASPAATSYTLDDIFNRLTTNATATEAGHAFAPVGAPGSTLHTLTQLYQAIPTINPSTLLSSATYLGITGTIQPRTLSASTGAVAAGYYSATTLPTVDTDLTAGNIKTGTTIFGVTGTLADYLYGDNSAMKVLTTAAAPGTYDATSLTAATVKSGTAFGVGLTGAYPSSTNTLPSASATTDLAGNGTAATTSNGAVEWWQSDGTRQTATLDFPAASTVCSTTTVNGAGGTLAIDGTKILSGTTYCGTAGTIQTRTLSAATGTLLAGYYAATTLPTIDADLTAGNIKSGTNIFGLVGMLASVSLTGMYDGTGQGFTGGSQANGGVDDYNNGASPPTGTYSAMWTQCTSGNSYCGTGDTGADAMDTSTNLVWSLPCNGSACASFADASAGSYTFDNSGGSNGAARPARSARIIRAGRSRTRNN